MKVKIDYLAVGGNVRPSAADYDSSEELLAFGAGINLAIGKPLTGGCLNFLLKGHTSHINAVRFIDFDGSRTCIISGSADGTIGMWVPIQGQMRFHYELHGPVKAHEGSVDCLNVANGIANTFVSGSADGTIKYWKIEESPGLFNLVLLQTVKPFKSLIPLSIACHKLWNDTFILAIGGTRSEIYIYIQEKSKEFVMQAVLTGHEGWIRSLDFVADNHKEDDLNSSLLLASASQDKYIRLWRICRGPGSIHGTSAVYAGSVSQDHEFLVSNRAHHLDCQGISYTIAFEALLAGHEDWIYAARWSKIDSELALLSVSADDTIQIWEMDSFDGMWYPSSRIGEVSSQKGSTSATGSMGGLWNGMWIRKKESILGLTKHGSWIKWDRKNSGSWEQGHGFSGHTRVIKGLSWAPNGSFLLSTSSDQTTRLHAEWIQDMTSSWHEFGRPQIHGYDINCIGTLGNLSFVSGSDEKLLRVFDQPDEVSVLLERLCLIDAPQSRKLHIAGIPVLGLSNKPNEGQEDSQFTSSSCDEMRSEDCSLGGLNQLSTPPLEEQLSKYTLWPEKEKLYGHGFEIHSLAVNHDSSLIATTCKATSLEHAVIRLFSTKDWQQIQPPLRAHTLTVTDIQFNHDSSLMLSVGRDRQWVVWKRSNTTVDSYHHLYSEAKAHTRMILSCSWISSEDRESLFCTGGRDKQLKIWELSNDEVKPRFVMDLDAPVMTLAAQKRQFSDKLLLAVGLENGNLRLFVVDHVSFQINPLHDIAYHLLPSLSITRLSWRAPRVFDRIHNLPLQVNQLAIASEDHSLRIISIEL